MILRTWAALLIVGASCATVTTDSDDIHVGFAAGSVLTTAKTDQEAVGVSDRELEEEWSTGGFVELMLRGETTILARLIGNRDEATVHDDGSNATFEQVMLCVLFSRELTLSGSLALRPMFGFGAGHVGIHYDSPSARDESGAAAVIAAGLELEIARHAMIGAMAWGGLFGDPGDTEGDVSCVMVYGGFRL